ncbi:metallophosphoesterase [Nibribacter ruber]|uniref:Metallophosphoesterase n=1 Tax=Nibribacter ruber TaxID=2698458 RepID=A0A6P1NWV8_9BACT|nr:metallophosphoesterase [Nibribacter ruber]QHL86295.1 metallophosphoesterase [Nibribacter ruber]
MLFQLVLFLLIAFLTWLLWSYYKERKYRKKPFYAMSEIGWRTQAAPPLSERIHSIALVGDIGNAGAPDQDPVLKTLDHWLQEVCSIDSTAVFLGDNIYPVGLPPQGHRHHGTAVQKLTHQLELLAKYKTRAIYLGGNHDWNKGRKDGHSYMQRQQEFITMFLQDQEAYLPKNGCLGPVTREINEQLLLVVINSQWWVQRGFRPLGEKYGCDLEVPSNFFVKLEEILAANRHRMVVIAGHHPLYTNALHGGKFTVKQRLFPLTFVHKRAMIPLPVFGTLYQLYRKYVGAAEDMSYPPFRRFRKKILKVLHQYPGLFYVAGHDHNLQYFQVKGSHFAVSGSGSKTNFVAKGGRAFFNHENKGFMVLDQYQNGEVWLRVLEPGAEGEAPVLMYHKRIYQPTPRPHLGEAAAVL